jgi:probable FeS assembly SUF system protein SufT
VHGQGSQEEITFCRDADAIIIPDGFKIMVPLGTEGVIMQELGGNYTVRVDTGYLVRVNALDADAIGKAVDPELAGLVGEDFELDEERVYDILRSCYDPEIPVNIVDLGLVYGCDISEMPDSEGQRVDVQMTLTAPGCGMGQVLKDDVEAKLTRLPGVSFVQVEMVFDPPWAMDRMSEAARLELGFE